MTGNRIKANLPRGYEVGRLINYRDEVYRIVAHGPELSAFPGGTGVVEMELELVFPGLRTVGEMRELAEQLRAADPSSAIPKEGI